MPKLTHRYQFQVDADELHAIVAAFALANACCGTNLTMVVKATQIAQKQLCELGIERSGVLADRLNVLLRLCQQHEREER